MVTYENKLYGLADNVQFKRTSLRNKKGKYFLYIEKRAYPVKGLSAKLLESIISFGSVELSDISNSLAAIKKCFTYFLESDWIREKAEDRDKKLILSEFTYCTIINNKSYLVNFLYKTVDRISKGTYDKIINNESDKISLDELFYLYTRKYLKDMSANNEINCFKNHIDNKIVYLIFSYACNLRCSYCFERSKDRSLEMSREVLEEALKLIESLSIRNNVVINFYGGEPLLEKNKDRLTAVIDYFKENDNIYYRFITNGVNIKEYIFFLNQIKKKIINFVITLDGTKEIHDSRRRTGDLHGSFDSIMDSIDLLNKYDFPIVIRINIDKSNLGCQEELIRYLNRTINKKSKVKIDYHRVEDKSNFEYKPLNYLDCYKLYLKMKNISKFEITFNLQLINVLNTLGKNENSSPYIKNSHCTIDSNYIIDFDGKVYSCNESMGNEAFRIGELGQELRSVCETEALDGNCSSCALYLLCYGGCYLENDYYKKCKGKIKCDYDQFKGAVDFFLENM